MADPLADRIRRTLDASTHDPALEEADGWASWGDVRVFAGRLGALLADAGCAAGRVGIVIRNRPSHAAAVIGLLAASRSISCLYSFGPPEALGREIQALGGIPVLLDEEDVPGLAGAIAEARGPAIALPRCLAAGPRLVARGTVPVPAGTGQSGIEVLSSGTTGPPKRLPMPMRLLERAVASAPGAETGTVPPVQINVWPLGGRHDPKADNITSGS